MSHKRKKNRDRSRSRESASRSAPATEDNRSVAVTVAWLIATLATGMAMCFSAVAYALTRSIPGSAENPQNLHQLAAIPGLLWFVALVTGILSLVLIPVVYRLRPTRPPLMVTASSVGVAISPWIVVLIRAWT